LVGRFVGRRFDRRKHLRLRGDHGRLRSRQLHQSRRWRVHRPAPQRACRPRGGAAQRPADNAYAIQQQEQAEREKLIAEQQTERNQTTAWIKANFPQYSNLPPAQAWQAAMGDLQAKRSGGSDMPSNVQEWEYFSKLPPDQQSQYLIMKRSNPYLDTGIGFVQPNPVAPGTTAGPMIAKDNMTPAYDAAFGKGAGTVAAEVGAEADSLASKMPGLQKVVAELGVLADTATYTQTGQLWDTIVRETGNMPPEGAIARTKFMAMVDNQVLPLLRDTFGAAFTVKEGESLRATLGDPNKSPPEKKAALEAFIEQKVRDLQALQSRAGGTAPGANNDPLGIR
jgi:hypothetical protein